jgi:hypothetical protein
MQRKKSTRRYKEGGKRRCKGEQGEKGENKQAFGFSRAESPVTQRRRRISILRGLDPEGRYSLPAHMFKVVQTRGCLGCLKSRTFPRHPNWTAFLGALFIVTVSLNSP